MATPQTAFPAVAATPSHCARPRDARSGHSTALADAACQRGNLSARASLVDEFNRQWASIPTITLTGEQVARIETKRFADQMLELDMIAMQQHWNWWADYYAGKRRQVLSPWHNMAPKVTQHFIANRERLLASAVEAFSAYPRAAEGCAEQVAA